MNKLEMVLVCVNYGDFLRHTLKLNRDHFDKVVVVTDKNDIDTLNICKQYDSVCVVTDRMYERGHKFNKGKALNEGIANLNRDDWVLITDADMVMPPDLRLVLENADLKIDQIYGSPRIMCPSYDDWTKYLNGDSIIGTWKKQSRAINIGVGFFQLVNSKCDFLSGRNNWYVEKWGFAGRSDRAFWRSYPPNKRGKINIMPIHLDSEPVNGYGRNWFGRITRKFDI